jgi:hypothetical protein
MSRKRLANMSTETASVEGIANAVGNILVVYFYKMYLNR